MTTKKTPEDSSDDKVVPIADAKKGTAKKAAAKKTTKKKAAPKKATSTAAIAQATRDLIFKHTKMRPADTKGLAIPYVGTGSTLIDHMIGGNLTSDGKGPKCPGFPRKRITEVYGPESSGKTTLALHGIVEAQRDGGVALFLDFEHALDHEYARKIGVNYNKDKLIYYKPENLEQGLKMMYAGIALGVDFIALDSIAALVTKKELEKSLDKEERIGERARQLSRFLPKLVMWLSSDKYAKNKKGTAVVFINQTRQTIGGSNKGSGETTPGGRALKFFAYLRLRVVRTGSEVIKRKDEFTGKEQTFPYGNKTKVKITKTKIDATSGWTTDIFIRFGKGIDDHYSVIEAGATKKVIKKKSGGWYSFGEHSFQGRDNFRAFLLDNPKIYDEIKARVLEAVRSTKFEASPEPDGHDAVLAEMDKEFGEPEDEEDEFGFESEDDMDGFDEEGLDDE
jgi:recombination protein RecA